MKSARFNQPWAMLVEQASRFMFFTGKGGVGKTSLACATALGLSETGRRVLLVSTDPASNLDEVLGHKLRATATAIAGTQGLFALNINPEEAARAYRERLIGPMRGKLPETALRSMEEQLSGACTLEIAAFDEFSKLLGDASATADFDHVVFDTAPTGHTLRLLTLPKAWTGFFETNTTGTSCLGPLAGLQRQRALYEASVAALADPALTTLVLVSRAQVAALREAQRTATELAALGVTNQRLVLNGRFRAHDPADPTAAALAQRDTLALRHMQEFLDGMDCVEVPLRAQNMIGLDALRSLFSEDVPAHGLDERSGSPILPKLATLDELVDTLAGAQRGVVMTMGKGGVGKTTMAAAIATELVQRGFPVHLTTTDPAAHVAAAVGDADGLTVTRIDPALETKAYVEQVMTTVGRELDAASRALLEEDLRSPCTEEIAVFRAFARAVAQGRDGFVVLDTAPTGHTLLLLDTTEAYHREVMRKASEMPDEVRELLPRLRDPDFTRVLVVTLPEATPVHEAAVLQEDLRRAGLEPYAWIINQSFAECGSNDWLLRQRALNEASFIREVATQLSTRTALVSWVREEPVGPKRLRQLFQSNLQPLTN